MSSIFCISKIKKIRRNLILSLYSLGSISMVCTFGNVAHATTYEKLSESNFIKAGNVWSAQTNFMTKSGVLPQIQYEVNEFTDNLLTSVPSDRKTQVIEANNCIKILVQTNQPDKDSMIYGMVADTSHFPYDFYWKSAQNHWSYELRVTGKNQVEINTFGRLRAKYFEQRNPGNKKALKKCEDNFHHQFSFLIRKTQKASITEGLLNASLDPEIQFGHLRFFTESDTEDSEVLINATNLIEADRYKAKTLLKEKIPYLSYARSAVSFGCMVLHNEFPYEIPSASANLINRLFAPVYANGKGDDGRTYWELEEGELD